MQKRKEINILLLPDPEKVENHTTKMFTNPLIRVCVDVKVSRIKQLILHRFFPNARMYEIAMYSRGIPLLDHVTVQQMSKYLTDAKYGIPIITYHKAKVSK